MSAFSELVQSVLLAMLVVEVIRLRLAQRRAAERELRRHERDLEHATRRLDDTP